MDVITTGVIASTIYDILKSGVKLSGDILKNRLTNWIKDTLIADALATEIEKLNINDELSELAINRRLESSSQLITLIQEINKKAAVTASSTINTVTQNHNGSGDNVAGNKITR